MLWRAVADVSETTDQEEFVELLEGTVPGRRSTGFDELCKGSI